MDLNRLEKWSRRVLEREARRIGIPNPSTLPLLDLVTSILHARTDSQETDSRARRALQTALFVLENLVRMAEVAIPTRNQPVTRRRSEESSRPSKNQTVSPHQQQLHFEPEAPSSAPSNIEKAPSAAQTSLPVIEPQIHSALENQPAPPAPDHIVTRHTDASTLIVQWNLSDATVERTHKLRKLSGTLSARAIIVEPDTEHVIRTETRDHPNIATQGEWALTDLSLESRVIVSIGLADGSNFVSIAHTPVESIST